MSWQPEIDELRRREELARRMGGPEKIKRQHDAGRMTIRERLDALLDDGSFHEIGAIAGKGVYDDNGELESFRPSNSIFGRGRIDGRPVVIAGDDFTVRGGAADATIHEKQIAAEQMANELGLPIVRLVEGTGGGGSVKTLETDGRTYLPANPGWDWVVANMGRVPVVALALGPVAGLGAARVATSHYSLMVKGQSQLFVAGPPVVKYIGEDLDKQELGGHAIQTAARRVDHAAEDEEDAFACARRFLSYLPSSVHDLPPRGEQMDDPDRQDEMLDGIIPKNTRKVYRMRKIIGSRWILKSSAAPEVFEERLGGCFVAEAFSRG